MVAVKDSIDELVQSVSCYNPRPLALHGYIGPFVSIYVLLVYSWFSTFSGLEFQESWFIAVAVVVVLQVLSYLSCVWSVHINCFLAYSKVSLIRITSR